MSSPLHPLGEYVVAQAEAADTKTASGLYLPDNAQEKPKTARVLATGPAERDSSRSPPPRKNTVPLAHSRKMARPRTSR